MALVAVATPAAGLGAHHAVGDVADAPDVRLVIGRPEGGPTGAALELGLVQEQRQAAKAAAVDAVVLLVEQAATERGLGAVLEDDLPFLLGQVSGEDLLLLTSGSLAVGAGIVVR